MEQSFCNIFTRKNSTTAWRKCKIRHESIDSSTKSSYLWMYTTNDILREWTQTGKLFLHFSRQQHKQF